MAEDLVVPVGTYGGQSVGAKGQNWYGNPDPWFRRIAGESVEKLFATTSCDRAGCVQVRGYGGFWLVALTRHFEARGQTTWRVARLARGDLAQWLPTVAQALRQPAADAEFAERDRLLLRAEPNALRRVRRSAMPWLQGLDEWCRGDRAPARQPILCLADPAEAEATPDSFARLLVCAARLAEVDGQVDSGPRDDYGIAVMPAAVAEREHSGFLAGRWAAILAPGAPGNVRGAETLALPRRQSPVRGVEFDRLLHLPDHEFDDLLWTPGRPNSDWIVPARLVPVALRTADEWRCELEALWRDGSAARHRLAELGEQILTGPEPRSADDWGWLVALMAVSDRLGQDAGSEERGTLVASDTLIHRIALEVLGHSTAGELDEVLDRSQPRRSS